MNGMTRWIVSFICSGGAFIVIASMTNATANDLPEAQSQAPVTYTIEKGDTLWDISSRFLNAPWSWPKLWKNNAYINNPDLIYPGNQLVINYQNGTISPIAPIPETGMYAADPANQDDGYTNTADANPETFSSDSTMSGDGDKPAEAAAMKPTAETVKTVATPTKPGLVHTASITPGAGNGPKAISYPSIDQVGFVRMDPVQGIGTILKEIDDHFLIGDHDRVYVKTSSDSPALIPGEVYSVYRITKHVIDPRTGKQVGVHHYPTGRIRIDQIDGKGAVATVVKSYRSLKAGDRLLPYTPREKKIYRTPAASGLTGYFLMSDEHLYEYSQATVAFINKGRIDGVDQGQEYTIYSQEKDMPALDIGRFLVLHAEDTVSSVVITQSIRAIHDGDLFRAKN